MKIKAERLKSGISFTDYACYDAETKMLKSVRDGVQEYLGAELDIEPADKVFKVYRSPASIIEICDAMVGIPITDDHISLDDEIEESAIRGTVTKSHIANFIDNAIGATIVIKNIVQIDSDIISLIKSGKDQLSLGYNADLIVHDGEYDFEQVGIVPHHLAIVDSGRCGGLCAFNDKQGVKMNKQKNKSKVILKKKFADKADAPNLQRIVEIAMALPDAIKTVPIEDVQKVLPELEKLIALSKKGDESADTETVGEAIEEPAKEVVDEAEKEAKADVETKDEAPAEDDKDKAEPKPKFSDADFKDAVAKAVDYRVNTITKAQEFVADGYTFSDKSISQIQRDALETESKDSFSDAELGTAFKLLRKSKQYERFADSGTEGESAFKTVGEKEL
jgi:hypothetical protein